VYEQSRFDTRPRFAMNVIERGHIHPVFCPSIRFGRFPSLRLLALQTPMELMSWLSCLKSHNEDLPRRVLFPNHSWKRVQFQWQRCNFEHSNSRCRNIAWVETPCHKKSCVNAMSKAARSRTLHVSRSRDARFHRQKRHLVNTLASKAICSRTGRPLREEDDKRPNS
jgi:hypothetical protein